MVYCARADQGESVIERVSEQELSASLKVNALLAEHVYVSAGHLLASAAPLKVLESLAPLTESGAVVLGLREDCTDVHSFAEAFLDNRRLGARSDEGRIIRERARRAEALLTSAVRWSPASSQKKFKESLLANIENPRSALRRRLTATRSAAITEFREALVDTPEEGISRRRLRKLACRYMPHRVRAIMREVNLLYYMVGSLRAGLVPDLLPAYFDEVTRAARTSPPKFGAQQYEAFHDLLDALVLPSDVVTRLSTEAIVKIRTAYHAEVYHFRKKWWAALERAHGKADDQPIHEVLREVLAEEGRGLRRYERVCRGISVASLFVSLASLAPEPTLAALSFAVSLLSSALESDAIKHGVVRPHLHVLGTRLCRSAAAGASRCGT